MIQIWLHISNSTICWSLMTMYLISDKYHISSHRKQHEIRCAATKGICQNKCHGLILLVHNYCEPLRQHQTIKLYFLHDANIFIIGGTRDYLMTTYGGTKSWHHDNSWFSVWGTCGHLHCCFLFHQWRCPQKRYTIIMMETMGMDEWFHPTLNWTCDYLSMLVKGPGTKHEQLDLYQQ